MTVTLWNNTVGGWWQGKPTAPLCCKHFWKWTLTGVSGVRDTERAQRLSGRAYLAGSAGFSSVPATVCATVACEGGAAAQQDVEDDPEAPKVTALVVEGRLISEHLHHFWSHVLCWATLREGQYFKKNTQEGSINCYPLAWFCLCVCDMNSK